MRPFIFDNLCQNNDVQSNNKTFSSHNIKKFPQQEQFCKIVAIAVKMYNFAFQVFITKSLPVLKSCPALHSKSSPTISYKRQNKSGFVLHIHVGQCK